MEQVLPQALRTRNSVIPNGVDIDRFRWRDRAQARTELGWDPGGKVAVFLGDPADPRKNVALAQQAVERVRAVRPELRLQVVWKIPVGVVPTVMNAADLLVFPSHSEGSPNAIKEAMASELPIVATPVGDIRERLGDVDGCAVVRPEVTAFGQAIERLVDQSRAPAARKAVESLSTDRVAERILEIYSEVLSGPSAAPGDHNAGHR
jgi:glycosyltransferase involved in cell wall biosynthesis